jgi:1-acyl-sn-glycerol-3-phosphate acyltransferase
MTGPPATIDTYRAGFVFRTLRRVTRLTRGLATTVLRSAAWAIGSPLHRGPERARAWRVRCFRGWARALCRIGAIHVHVEGEPPRTACVLVTNHVGYADIITLAAVLEAPAFVSMHEIRGWPLVGFMAERMGTIFIDRANKRAIPAVNAAIESALEHGQIVVLFAEGANSDGSQVRPFRASLLAPAARLGAPCAWGTTHYDVLPGDPPPSRSVCWQDDPIWRQAPRFLALERIDAHLAFGADTLRSDDRKQLAARLHERVVARFRPME